MPADRAGEPAPDKAFTLADAIQPDWPAPRTVRGLMSTRRGGAGQQPFDTFNLGRDPRDPAAAANRARWARQLGAQPVWLHQVHGCAVAVLDAESVGQSPTADASVTMVPGVACTVLAADCMPVLLCVDDGRAVGAAHAGWRGLAAGVLERSVDALCHLAGCAPGDVLAWMGPCIGPRQFEVGEDVLLACAADPSAESATGFQRRDRPDGQRRWLADLPALARGRLVDAGVHRIHGGHWCTVEDPSAFFSFRRDGSGGRPSGRMAASLAIVG
jgi:polyphenol oxidase